MTSNDKSLDINKLHMWDWFRSEFKHSVNIGQISRCMNNIGITEDLLVSIIGVELRLFPCLSINPDISILLQPNKNNSRNKSQLCELMDQIIAKHIASSIWLEFDYPYSTFPLIYFTLSYPTETFNKQSLIVEYYQELRNICQDLTNHHCGNLIWPSVDDFAQWYNNLPRGEIQQMGFCFRNMSVQVRCLLKASKDSDLAKLMMHDIERCLEPIESKSQSLYAFAYPYRPEDMFAYEVLTDQLAKQNLRDMRQPPRMRGTEWLNSLRCILQCQNNHIGYDRGLLRQLSRFERRETTPVNHQVHAHADSVDLSSWNHYKLSFEQQHLKSIKLYGGTVRNELESKNVCENF